MNKPTFAIMGAGIIGVTTAYYLVNAGYKVILLDESSEAVTKTSFANGGQLSYTYVDAMSSPSLLKKMPKVLLGFDPAFKVKLNLSYDFMNWGVKFALNGLANKELKNTHCIYQLAQQSKDEMKALLLNNNVEFNYRNAGKLILYSSLKEFEAAKLRVKQKRQWGCEQEILSKAACIELEPALQFQENRIIGGVYSKEDDVGDCPAFAQAILSRLEDNEHFNSVFNCKVNAINLTQDKRNIISLNTTQGDIDADRFILTAGPYSNSLAKQVGLNLPIYPVKGYSITVPAKSTAPEISITDMANKMVITKLGDKIRVAGCADIVGFDEQIDNRRIQHLVSACKKHFSEVGDFDRLLHTWCGFRPVTPSSVPIIGQAGPENFYLNVGHGMLGWTLAMGSASYLLSQIEGSNHALNLDGIKPKMHGLS